MAKKHEIEDEPENVGQEPAPPAAPKGEPLTPFQYPTPATPPREYLDKVIVATWTPGKGWAIEAHTP